MLRLSPRLLVTALALGLASPLFAATYIVPSDAEMIQRSDDIVIATAVTSTVERTPRGGIVTRYILRIEEVLKGQREPKSYLTLTEIGGQLSGEGLYVSGMPVYEPGERYLVFSDANGNGDPRTFGMELGQFFLRKDDDGRLLALREAFGFTQNLDPFREGVRDARGFIEYVRGIVAQRIDSTPTYFIERPVATNSQIVAHVGSYTRKSYLLFNSPRWEGTPNASMLTALAPTGANGVSAVESAIGQWNGTAANISYTYSRQDDTAINGFGHCGNQTCGPGDSPHDGKDTVLFNDPNGEVDPPVLGRGGFWTSGATHDVGGETGFRTINGGVDVVIDNISFSQCLLDVVMWHELGHTLGFRHSNQDPDESACDPSVNDCTSDAIMNSSVGCGPNGLLEWDQNAAATVYGAGPQCTPPVISPSGQPQNVTITQGNSTTLTVAANGTGPFTYQWFIGSSGDRSNPTGTNSPSLNVTPTSTTSYWVHISGQCTPPVSSETATVTVNPPTCTPPSIIVHPQSNSITSGQSAQLSVNAAGTGPFVYRWFIGAKPNTSQPVGDASLNAFITVSPTATTQYWVRVTGNCGSPADSDSATITVSANTCPDITVGGPTATKQGNGSYVLNVTASQDGPGALTYQWFQGSVPGVGPLVGTGQQVTVPAPTAAISYWVRVSNNCGKQVTSATVVTIAPCELPVITGEPANQSIANGASATLNVGFTSATAATVTWFRGTAPDKSNPAGAGATFNTGALTATTNFWASITNTCGEKFTRTVTVTVATACTAPAILTTSPAQTKLKNETVTLTVAATGTAALNYQWYEGASGNISTPRGTNSPTFTSGPLTASTQFWVKVTNSCGNVNSSTINVDVKTPRHRAVRK